jgi:hypothetical protein
MAALFGSHRNQLQTLATKSARPYAIVFNLCQSLSAPQKIRDIRVIRGYAVQNSAQSAFPHAVMSKWFGQGHDELAFRDGLNR